MRIAFFLLLFVNFVLLLWQTQIAQSDAGPELPPVPADKQLVLLAEHEARQRGTVIEETPPAVVEGAPAIPDIELSAAATSGTVEAAVPADTAEQVEQTAPAPEPALNCSTIGPFKDFNQAKTVIQRLKGLGAQVSRRDKTEQELFGYRVFLPPYASREKAQAATKELARNGIYDYFIITDQDQQNGISLGVFRKKDGAQRRMAQVSRFDFKPQMEVRYRDAPIYWLDYEQKGELVTDQIWREISENTPGLQRLPRDCGAKPG
jgi:cell division septation protein DedD